MLEADVVRCKYQFERMTAINPDYASRNRARHDNIIAIWQSEIRDIVRQLQWRTDDDDIDYDR